jgi:hypothetical protein
MKDQVLSPEAARAWLEPLPREEFDRRLRAAIDELAGEELENILELLRWFRTRYPTARARLAYNRAKYEQLAKRSGIALRR